MGIFGTENKVGNGGGGRANTGWDNMAGGVPAGEMRPLPQINQKKMNAARQQRKIIVGLLGQDSDKIDTSVIEESDAKLLGNMKGQLLANIRDGLVNERKERQFLQAIASPVSLYGADKVAANIWRGNVREGMIMDFMSRVTIGMERVQGKVTGRDVENFMKAYPTPIDFEGISNRFLDGARGTMSREEYDNYSSAMKQLKYRVYGKRQEYWEQMKVLNAEAHDKEIVERNFTHPEEDLAYYGMAGATDRYGNQIDVLSSPEGAREVIYSPAGEHSRNKAEKKGELVGIFRKIGKLANSLVMGEKNLGAAARRPEYKAESLSNRLERERSAEWVPGVAAVRQVSKYQVWEGRVNSENMRSGLWADESCQDSYINLRNRQVYGVFDGVGSNKNGGAASREAARALTKIGNSYNLQSGMDLAWALTEANRAVYENTPGDNTTAVLAKVVERDGQKMLAFASAGDSRIYIVDKRGKARLITKDEGVGRGILNWLGKRPASKSNIEQFGEAALKPGDRVVLCSDGITGDYGDDLMSEKELGRIVAKSRSAEEAAANLVMGARKTDDRTAVVFAV